MIKFLVLNLILVSVSFARGGKFPDRSWAKFQVIDSGAVIQVTTWKSVRSHINHGYKTKSFEKYVEIDGLRLEGDEVVYNGVVCGKLGVTRVFKRSAILTTGNCEIILDKDVPSIELR